MNITSCTPKETFKLGYILGKNINKGSIVCIEGDMGAGKTALSQGIIRGLGVVDEYITSPTYTIVNEYNLKCRNVYHFDIYRLENYDELIDMGFEEYLNDNDVVIIEWADKIKEDLPKENIWVKIERDIDQDKRVICIEGLNDFDLTTLFNYNR